MSRFINPVPQYLNSAGDPIVSGQMFFYEVGSTTPKDVYLDAALTIPAANPVLLNADGRMPDTYLLGSYRTILSEPSSGEQWERDNVGSEFTDGYGRAWNSTVTYNAPEVVLYDGVYYMSLTNNNIDNTPGPNSGNWKSIYLGAVGRNLLDNSNGQIHQRGTGAAPTGGYHLDRWVTSAGAGGTSTIQARRFSNSNRDWYIRMVTAGNTAPQYIEQTLRPELFKLGSDYTFTVSLGTLSVQGTVGRMRVWALSGGVYNDIHDEEVILNSDGSPSITFNYTDQGFDLSGPGDGIVVRLLLSDTGGAPDGNWNFRSFKLEEGNTYTGYEPTPYGVDETECMKWYQVPFDTDSISPFYANIFRSAGTAGAQDHVMNVQIRPKMYAAPSAVDETYISAVAPDDLQTNRNSMRLIWINISSPTSEVGVENLALSCEI